MQLRLISCERIGRSWKTSFPDDVGPKPLGRVAPDALVLHEGWRMRESAAASSRVTLGATAPAAPGEKVISKGLEIVENREKLPEGAWKATLAGKTDPQRHYPAQFHHEGPGHSVCGACGGAEPVDWRPLEHELGQ